MGDAVKQIGDALERVFRHLLPGVCLLIAAQLSHPSWLRCVDYGQSQQLLLLAIIAVCAGNIWYIFHRYTVHQLIDFMMYRRAKITGKIKNGNYPEWLIAHISSSFSRPECKGVEMRAAQVIFMFIVCEIAFISACYHEQCSWFGQIGKCNFWIGVGAVAFSLFAIWQYYVLFNVDREIVAKSKIVANPPAAASHC
jgi:hypothetical protein